MRRTGAAVSYFRKKDRTKQEFLYQRMEHWRLFLLIFSLAGVGIALQLYMARGAIREAEVGRLQDASRYVSENLNRQLVGLDEALVSVRRDYQATLLTLASTDTSRQLHLLTKVVQAVRGLVVYDANGTSVASDQDAQVGKDFYSESFFKSIKANPDPDILYLSRPSTTDGDRSAVHLSRAIFDERGEFTGVVSANLDEEFFAFTVRSALFSPDMRATLALTDGDIFVTVPPTGTRTSVNVSTPGSAFERHVIEKRQSTIFEGLVPATGRERLLVLTTVRPLELRLDNAIVLAVSRGRPDVYAPWHAQVRFYGTLYFVVLFLATTLRLAERQRRKKILLREAQAQAALRLSATRLERALDGAQLGLWELHVNTQQLQLDARGAQMLSYQGTDVTKSSREWTETLHPADRQKNLDAFAAHLKGDTAVYENEFRVSIADSKYIWLFSRGKVTERSAQGFPLRVIGTFMDITDRKSAEAALAQAAALLKRSGDIAHIGGWSVEIPSGKAHWSEEVYRIHDLDPSETPDLSQAINFYTEESRPVITAAVERGIRDGTPWDLELQIVTAKGRLVWVRAQGEAIYEEGEVVRIAGAFQDITARKEAALELERLNARLSEMSYEDALTGLGNRRLFDDTIASEWGRNARQQSTLSVLMIDIDYFKRFNDLRGHLEGDECLRRVAQVLKGAMRRSHERAMRYGGEEFAILLPETSLEGAEQVGARILESINSARIAHGASAISPWVTLSIGVAATIPTMDKKPTDLLRLADMALYDAKAQGRARVSVCTDLV